ncbi:MAG: insulinase family protein [Methanomassiliicoccales archaeon]|nr:insulinase family protein [Methanomassiliicoccales archaeon]
MRALGQMKVEVTPAGIPILVDTLPWSRSAAVAVNMAVGSRDEPSDQHGIAHLLEHVLFKGTGHHTSRQMSQEVEAAGGEMNGYTTKEMTAYYVSTLDETIGTAEDLLAEIVREPLLDVKDIETEKKVVTQEIRMSEDDPDTYSHELLMKKVWKGNPMSDPEAGYIECVEALDREKVSRFFEGFYRPPNMVVVASGNVEAKQVLKWATESFDGLPVASMPKRREAPSFKPGIQLFPREGDQAYVAMAFPAVDARHKDRYAHGLVGGILAAGTSSRLYQKVREENGLVYSIYSMSYAFTDIGMIGIFFSTSIENTTKVMGMIAEELSDLRNDGLEKGELDRAKRWIKGMIVRRLESSAENRMFFLGESYLQFGRPITGDEVLGKIESVTEEDVLRVGKSMIDRKKLGLALYAEQRPGKRIAKNLESLDF